MQKENMMLNRASWATDYTIPLTIWRYPRKRGDWWIIHQVSHLTKGNTSTNATFRLFIASVVHGDGRIVGKRVGTFKSWNSAAKRASEKNT